MNKITLLIYSIVIVTSSPKPSLGQSENVAETQFVNYVRPFYAAINNADPKGWTPYIIGSSKNVNSFFVPSGIGLSAKLGQWHPISLIRVPYPSPQTTRIVVISAFDGTNKDGWYHYQNLVQTGTGVVPEGWVSSQKNNQSNQLVRTDLWIQDSDRKFRVIPNVGEATKFFDLMDSAQLSPAGKWYDTLEKAKDAVSAEIHQLKQFLETTKDQIRMARKEAEEKMKEMSEDKKKRSRGN